MAKRYRLSKERPLGRQRHAQAGPDKVGLEPRRECGMSHDGSEIRHHVLGRDRLRVGVR